MCRTVKKGMIRKSFLMKFCILFLTLLVFTSVALAEGGEQSSSQEIEGQKPLGFIAISLMDGERVQGADNLPAKPKQQETAASAGGDNDGEAPVSPQQMEPENYANAGIKLNFIDWITILVIALILIWIAVQLILMKRKKKGF